MTSTDETATGNWNNELQDMGFDNVAADAAMLGDDELSLAADDGVVAPSAGKRKATDANDADGEDDDAAPAAKKTKAAAAPSTKSVAKKAAPKSRAPLVPKTCEAKPVPRTSAKPKRKIESESEEEEEAAAAPKKKACDEAGDAGKKRVNIKEVDKSGVAAMVAAAKQHKSGGSSDDTVAKAPKKKLSAKEAFDIATADRAAAEVAFAKAMHKLVDSNRTHALATVTLANSEARRNSNKKKEPVAAAASDDETE